MKITEKKWQFPNCDWQRRSALARELSISPITAQILLNRGILTGAEARVFLYGSLSDLSSPWELPGMENAVNRIAKALREQENIFVFGDYDVDGITSTAVLVSFLQEQGASVGYYIPERSDGYGLNRESLDYIQKQGCNLVITVDCGISAAKEIAYGKEIGLDFVVTDHHEPGLELPDCPVVNPKLGDSGNSAYYLAGVGVAYKLIHALNQRLGGEPNRQFDYLDLVALGTIADVVPLLNENRLLVKHGLNVLRRSKRIGIKALCEVASVECNSLDTNQVAFALAPRLNAAGRLGSPLVALELLLSDSVQKSRELALKLQELNASRQLLVQQVLKEAIEMVEEQEWADREKVLVLASEYWHPGVIGIVAAKLVEHYCRPVIMLSIEGEQAKGSGRSIPGFDLFVALTACQDLLLKAGGHALAAGITLKSDQVDAFRCKINEYAIEKLDEELMTPSIETDAEVLYHQLDLELIDELALLEPFGQGNPRPLLVLRNVFFQDYRVVGKTGNHLKFRVRHEVGSLDGIGFGMADLANNGFNLQVPLDLVFRLECNQWNGQKKVQLVAEDIKNHEKHPEAATISEFPLIEQTQQPIIQCIDGTEQFQLLISTILAEIKKGNSVCVVFPSQRLLAIYEKLLLDILAVYQISCQRLRRNNHSQVLLTVDSLFTPGEDCKVLRVVFPGWNSKAAYGRKTDETMLGFKKLEPGHVDFVRTPVMPRDKLAFIEPIVRNTTGPIFIYASRKKQVMELFQGLQLMVPHKKNKIWYFHQGMCLSQKEITREAVASGLAEIVVAGEFLEMQLPETFRGGKRILVDAPYCVEELFLKCRSQQPGTTIYGIWHETELTFNEATLSRFFPTGHVLETLLRSVRELGTAREEELSGLMNGSGVKATGITRPTLEYVMDIMAEVSFDYRNSRIYQAAEAEKKALARLRELELTGFADFQSLVASSAP